MKKTLLFIILVAYSALTMKSQTISIDSTFTSDGIIYPFTGVDTIYGLQLSGSVGLQTDTSLVRVILADSLGEEYMVYEAYPLICTQDSFAIEEVCDETCFLDCFEPYSLRIEIIGASIYIDEVLSTGEYAENLLERQYAEKRSIDENKADHMNMIIPLFEMNWEASDENSLVELFYTEKKEMFGEKYNLLGFDYYYKGIFEYLWVDNYETPGLDLVKSFDWRYRHDATDSSSVYFEENSSQTGWLTSIKDQGIHGTCWAHAACGSVESIFNLFYNQHLDLNLSEQDLISCCVSCVVLPGGISSRALGYISNYGVVTENCFPYDTTGPYNALCSEKCSDNDTLAYITGWDSICNHIDSIRLALIEDGPLTADVEDHSMVLVGYYTDYYDSTIVWVFKNSYGVNDNGLKGFTYMKIPADDIRAFRIKLPVQLSSGLAIDTICRDADNDGYCWWGIGENKPNGCNCQNLEPDCNDNDPNVGPYDSCYNCMCYYSYQGFSDTIYGTLIYYDTTIVDEVVLIGAGGHLSVSSLVQFTEGAGIIVLPGGELEINGGHLTHACNDLWRGIEVWGEPDTTQNFSGVQGKVTISNNSVIENAEIGILLGARDSSGTYIFTHSGGIVQAENTTFNNNTIDVEFLPYQNIHPYDKEKELDNISSLKKCTFDTYWDNDFYPIHQAHIKLRDVKGISIEGCVFKKNEVLGFPDYNQNSVGILSENGSFTLKEFCNSQQEPCENFDTCKFINLRYGIKVLSWDLSKNLTIQNVQFINNHLGVLLSGVANASILSNEFYAKGNTLNNEKTGGLYLEQCTGYHVENNEFYANYEGDTISETGGGIGLYILNSGQYENEVYRNTFHNLRYATIACGTNRNENDSTGLCYKCNTFYYNKYDISIVEDSNQSYNGIAYYQGSPDTTDPTAPANNIFSDIVLDNSDIYNQGRFIVYYHPLRHDDYKVIPEYYNEDSVDVELNAQEFDEDLGCPSTLGGSTREEMETRLACANSDIGVLSDDLDELIDGGNTEELNSDIQFSQPQEALQLRQQLLDDSPYLSDTVMKSAIDKENVLPNAMIRDVLVANPQSAKSSEVIEQLNQRFVPMPGYMMGQIMNGKNITSAKEDLEARLSYSKTKKAKAINELVKFYKADTSVFSFDSTVYWLGQKNSPDIEYFKVFEYIRIGDTTEALDILGSISNLYNLNNKEYYTHQKFNDLISIYKVLQPLKGKVYQTDSISLAQLEVLSDDENCLPGIFARNILVANGFLDYQETYQLPNHLKLSKAIVYPRENIFQEKNEYLKIFPNPAKDYAIIEYSTTEIKTLTTKYIILIDNYGRKIKSIILNDVRNAFVLNTSGLLPGTYIVCLINGDKMIENKKLIIYE